MRILKGVMIGAICSASCTAGAADGGSAAACQFASVKEAVDAFATNSPSARGGIYRYVEDAAAGATDPRKLRVALAGLCTMAGYADMSPQYEEFCMQGGRACSNDAQKVEWFAAFARTPSLAKAPATVASRLESILSHNEGLSAAVRLELSRMLAEIYATNLSDPDKGMAILDGFMKRHGDNVALTAAAAAKQMSICRQAGRDAECEAKARWLVGLESCPDAPFAAASLELSRFAGKRGDSEAAGELIADSIERCAVVPVGYPQHLIKAKAGTNAVWRAISAIRRKIASVPIRNDRAFRVAVERWQPELIPLLVYCGRGEEALGECRVWVFFAPKARYQDAVNLTARTMKRVDGNLGRAVAFLNIQKKGVVPDVRNPMMSASRLDDTARRSLLANTEELRTGIWSDWLALSLRLLWLDDPCASVEAAMAAFSVAPFNGSVLQLCADAIMGPVLAATRDPDSARQVVDFLMYGGNGRDGRADTADDVRNPIEAFVDALRVGEMR